jgi:heme/copper-type cytochrome/quinol oxidase subunit 2
MNKKIKGFLFVIVCVIIFILCNYIETTYTRMATVQKIENDLVIALDSCGNLWEFTGDNYMIGDKVQLIMNTNHTDSIITDDQIKSVKKE